MAGRFHSCCSQAAGAVVKVAVGLAAALSITACAGSGTQRLSDPLFIRVDHATAKPPDPGLEQQSKLMHHYLLGELMLSEDNFGAARGHFEEAARLSDEPNSRLQLKLAELYVREGKLEEALRHSTKAAASEPENVDVLLFHAGVLDALGKHAEVEPIYRAIIEQHPDVHKTYIFLAGLYAKEDRFDDAAAILKRLIKAAPDDSVGYYYLGRMYERAGKSVQAEDTLNEALKRDPENSAIVMELVRIFLKGGKNKEAKALCKETLDKNPNDVLARRILGELLLGENRLDEALTHLEMLEGLDQNPTDVRLKIAIIYMKQQNFNEAIKELNLILAQQPGNAKAHYYLATIYAGQGQEKKAVEELLKVAADDEHYIKARTFAAFLLRQNKDLPGAESAVLDALKHKPGDTQLVSYLVVILRDVGRHGEAVKLLSQLVAEHPQNTQFRFEYAAMLQEFGDKKAGLAEMEKVIELDPDHSDALNYLAYTLAEEGGDLFRAKELATRALAIKPQDSYYLDTLGWINYQEGDYLSAKKHIKEALTIGGEDVVILEHYGDVLLKLGLDKEAVKAYERALQAAGTEVSAEEQRSIERVKEKLAKLTR